MRPPMFQYQPSPAAMRARDIGIADGDRPVHREADVVEQTADAPYQSLRAAPCAASATSTLRRDVARMALRVASASPGAVELLAAVLCEGLQQTELHAVLGRATA